MPIKPYYMSNKEIRQRYAEQAEACLNSLGHAREVAVADRLVAQAQVYATLALAFKD